jgi:hypothetical protein
MLMAHADVSLAYTSKRVSIENACELRRSGDANRDAPSTHVMRIGDLQPHC